MESVQNHASVEILNELLRGERSAVETYTQALDKLEQPFMAREELRLCHSSHQARVGLLERAVTNLGGTPAVSSGVWGTFTKLVEGGAKVLGAKVAIAALAEGEDYGLHLYQKAMTGLDTASSVFVERELIPEQEQTRKSIGNIKRMLDV